PGDLWAVMLAGRKVADGAVAAHIDAAVGDDVAHLGDRQADLHRLIDGAGGERLVVEPDLLLGGAVAELHQDVVGAGGHPGAVAGACPGDLGAVVLAGGKIVDVAVAAHIDAPVGDDVTYLGDRDADFHGLFDGTGGE